MTRRSRRAPARLLGNPDFRRLWIIGGLAGTVRWLEILTIGVFTFDLTGSPLWVAGLMVARMLPMVLFGSIFGAYADRFNRRSILLGGLAMAATTATVLAGLAAGGGLELWQVAVGAFLSGTYFSTDFPVRRTMLGDLAGEGSVGKAMALDAATNNATRMLGPLLGGLIYQAVGLGATYSIGAACYLLCWLLALRVTASTTLLPVAGTRFAQQLREGLRYVTRDRAILGTLLVTVIVNFFGFPFASMIPVIGRDEMALTPALVGVLASAEGTGAFLGTLVIAASARPRHYGPIYVAGSFAFLIAIVAFSLSPGFNVAWTVLLAGGLGVAGFASMQSTILLTTAEPRYRSRTMGALAVCIGAGPIGMLHVGALAERFGASTAVTVIGLEGLLAAILASGLWRALLRAAQPPRSAPDSTDGDRR